RLPPAPATRAAFFSFRGPSPASLSSLSLHDALPIYRRFWILGCVFALLAVAAGAFGAHALRDRLPQSLLSIYETAARYQMYHALDRKSTRLNSSHVKISYAVFCLKKKNQVIMRMLLV